MSARFLLDTNICIYVLANSCCEVVIRLDERTEGEVAVSSITCAEILLGAHRKAAEEVAKAVTFFDRLEIFQFDMSAALAYARLPFKRGSYDRLIAAHALSLELILVTNNEADFAGLPGSRIENWTRST